MFNLKEKLGFFVDSGITDNTEKSDRLRIKLVNQVLLVFICLASTYFFIFNYLGLMVQSYLVIPSVSLYLVCLLLNRYDFHRWAALGLIFSNSLIIFYYSSVLGKASGAHYVYFSLVLLPFIVLNPKEKFHIVLGFIIPIVSLLLLEITHFSIFGQNIVGDYESGIISIFATITTILISIASTLFYHISKQKAYGQLEKAYEDLKESRSEASELSRQLAIEELSRQSAYATLTRGIAHEIKNPLQILSGRAYLVLDDLDDKEGVKKFAEVMTRNIERLTKLIHSMLQYGASSGRDKETFCLCEMVEDIAEFSKSSAKEKRITITSHWTESLQVCGNKVFIYQALLNLVVNAIQYTPLGGQITFTCTQKEGVDSSDNTRMGVEVAVSDTGIGISEENLKQIFVPYFTSKVQPENTGLGLSMAFKTFAENDGRLDVESTVGVGTTFRAWLPVVK